MARCAELKDRDVFDHYYCRSLLLFWGTTINATASFQDEKCYGIYKCLSQPLHVPFRGVVTAMH